MVKDNNKNITLRALEPSDIDFLFDIENDPHELQNLAEDSAYSDKLIELRVELDSWLSGFKDLGFKPEDELIKELWPGGTQPTTKPPSIFLNNGKVQISSDTPGANIAFQIIPYEAALDESWRVYTGPFKLGSTNRLVAVAHRIGYLPSHQVEFVND